MLCPVCSGRGVTGPGQGCGACAATGFIHWEPPPDGGGLLDPAAIASGLIKIAYGTVALQHGAGTVDPAPHGLTFLTIQQARGRAGTPSVSHRTGSGFVISSTSADDESLVAWFIIEQ